MRGAAIATVTISVTAAALLLMGYFREDEPRSPRAGDQLVMPGDGAGAVHGESVGVMPASLAGTEIPDGVRVDSAGQLIIDPALQASFDYFLATSPDLSVEQKTALADRYLTSKLGEPALGQARALLGRYAAYLKETGAAEDGDRIRQAAQGNALPATGLDALRRKLDARRAMREKYLGGDVARNWFGEQDRLDQVALKRAELLASSLPDTEKRARLAALDAELPSDIRQARDASMQPARVVATIATLRQNGATDEVIRRRLNESVDNATAQRLSVMLQNNAAWDKSYQDYTAKRQQIEQMTGLDVAERKRRIDGIRSESFPKTGDALLAQSKDRVGSAQ
jgi:lipase chaperone LimK